MGEAALRSRMTPAEYLAFERASEEKHEYAGGEVFAMAGAKRRHNLITGNLVRELGQLLRERPCEVYPSDMRVSIPSEERYVYPDVTVVCDAPSFAGDAEDTLLNPTVILEVTSDSTEAYDRGEKFEMYRQLASLREYVLVSHRHASVDHYTRRDDGTWLLRSFRAGDRVPIPSCGIEVPVDEIYLKVVWNAA